MNQAILLLGGNLGDRKANLTKAIRSIEEQCGEILSQSKIYESEAWGFNSNDNFLNQAISINTSLTAGKLLSSLQIIEKEVGRIRHSDTYESRIMDIDILFYNSEITNTETLIVPHPRLHLRKFTLNCLMDIYPDLIHPTLTKSIEELLDSCVDSTKVWLYE